MKKTLIAILLTAFSISALAGTVVFDRIEMKKDAAEEYVELKALFSYSKENGQAWIDMRAFVMTCNNEFFYRIIKKVIVPGLYYDAEMNAVSYKDNHGKLVCAKLDEEGQAIPTYNCPFERERITQLIKGKEVTFMQYYLYLYPEESNSSNIE